MSLAKININEVLRQNFNVFLEETSIPFDVLKSLMTGKQPIAAVQKAMVSVLDEAKFQDESEARANLGDDSNTVLTHVYRVIEQQCAELTQEAETLNYSVFIDELENHLKRSQRDQQEIVALQSILILMRDHLRFEKEAENVSAQLQALRSSVTSLTRGENALDGSCQRPRSVVEVANKALVRENSRLFSELKYISATLIAITVPSIISLALLIIPVSIPIVLLGLVLVSVFIPIFFVNSVISFLKVFAINKNEATIQANNTYLDQMSSQTNDSTPLSVNQADISELENNLKEYEVNAEQALSKANDIIPTQYFVPPSGNTNSNSFFQAYTVDETSAASSNASSLTGNLYPKL